MAEETPPYSFVAKNGQVAWDAVMGFDLAPFLSGQNGVGKKTLGGPGVSRGREGVRGAQQKPSLDQLEPAGP